MAELNGNGSDRDLLIQLLTNQSNIEKKIDSFGIAISDLHLRIDRVETRIETKFDGFYDHCRDQRNDCNACIENKLPSKVFYWFCGVSSPLVIGGGAWVLTKIFEMNDKLATITSIINTLTKVNGG